MTKRDWSVLARVREKMKIRDLYEILEVSKTDEEAIERLQKWESENDRVA